MGFTTALLGGFTLTATALYLGVARHARNRAHQSALVRQQALRLDSIAAPPPPLPPPARRHVPAGLLATAKDRWNAELERKVRALQRCDWAAAVERAEAGAAQLLSTAFGRGTATGTGTGDAAT